MANRFAGLIVEDDDEPVAVAPAPAKAAPAPAAQAAPKAAAQQQQRAPRPAKADADAGFRQQGQVARPAGERPARTERQPRTERAPRDPAAPPREERPRQPRAPRVAEAAGGENGELPERKTRDSTFRHGEFKGAGRAGPHSARGASQAVRGKREYDRHGANRKESEKANNMGLGKAEKTDDAEPATVGELKVEAAEAAAVNTEAEVPKVEDEEDAKLKTFEQYKATVQKQSFDLPAARAANEGQDAFKNQQLLARDEEETLFARKEASKKAAVAKERKVVHSIQVEPKSLLDSRRQEPREPRSDSGRGGFRGGRGGRGGAASTPARAPRAPSAAAPNLNDQTAFPSLK